MKIDYILMCLSGLAINFPFRATDKVERISTSEKRSVFMSSSS